MKTASKIFIVIALMCISTTVYSQDCDSNLQRATELVSQKNYCAAERYYQAYANCNAEADVSSEIAICDKFCKNQDSEDGKTSFVQDRTDASLAQDRTDTIYYDKNWKGVSNPNFADFYRIAEYPANNNYKKQFHDYYITGELQARGEFISIDKYDDTRSVFDGELDGYFKNGQIENVRNFQNGKLNGDFCFYTEDGLVIQKGSYLNEQLDGLYTKFYDTGTCFQAEYQNGQPKYDYYVMSDTAGNVTQFHFADNKPFWNTPSTNERKTEYQDGVLYQYYVNNGLTVSLTNTKDLEEYGRGFRADIVIQNNSMVPIDFDPVTGITAYSIDKNEKQNNLEVYSYEKYTKKVHHAEVLAAVLGGIAGGLAAASTVYSTSTTTTNTHYNETHNNPGHPQTRSNPGNVSVRRGSIPVRRNNVLTHGNTVPIHESSSYTHGSYPGNSYHNGSVVHVTRTTTYQTLIMPQFSMAVPDSQWNIGDASQTGYLKRNTIYPGQSVAGYAIIQWKKGKTVFITITVNGANYEYAWNY